MKYLVSVLTIVVFAAGATLAAPPGPGPGAAELHLDRASVMRLVAAALPGPIEADLAGLGSVRVEVDPPSDLRFREGGVEMTLPVRLPNHGIATSAFLRYRPEIDPLYGVVRLVAETARLEAPAPFDVDLSPWVGSLPLPREARWQLELDGGAGLALRAYLHDVRVEEQRLVLVLGLRLGN